MTRETHQSAWYHSAVVRGDVTWSCRHCNTLKVRRIDEGAPPAEVHDGPAGK